MMRLAAHHRALGDHFEHVFAGNPRAVRRAVLARQNAFEKPDLVYASLIFTKTRPLAELVRAAWPHAVIGGTGWDFGKPERERATLEKLGIGRACDYSLYPTVTHSLGYLQRGCRLECPFCDVWRAEGKVKKESAVREVWRGEPHPRHLVLLDNDPFGSPSWESDFEEVRAGGFKVCFQQGFNARLIGRSHAAEIASLDYRAEDMKTRRLYCAWDNRADEKKLLRGLGYLKDCGVAPSDLLVYVLVGFDHATERPRPLHQDDLYRVAELRDFGALPYPMPFHRSKELVGFQRWAVGFYDVPRKDRPAVPWADFVAADYRPERLTARAAACDPMPLFGGAR